MNAQRFVAPNSREAMAQARAAFGDRAVILSSRSTDAGFEVVATSEDQLNILAAQVAPAAAKASQSALPEVPRLRSARSTLGLQQRAASQMPSLSPDSTVAQDTETLAMSTLSFQEYVRERMLRKRREAMQAQPQARSEGAEAPPAARAASKARSTAATAPQQTITQPGDHNVVLPFAHSAQRESHTRTMSSSPGSGLGDDALRAQRLEAQLSAMQAMMEERFQTLAWLGQAKLNPIQSQLMLKFIRAGYSPTVARAVLERLPTHLKVADAWHWTLEVLARNLRVSREPGHLCDDGGVYALIGSTGVGKTTTAAKLAAQCVKAYGSNSVGLITLDTHRVGGYEQLRSFGRLLGVVAHQAHDPAALQDLLELLAGKRMVIIDTAGMGQKDQRLSEMLALLQAPQIRKLLVVSASSHGDTMDDVFRAYRGASLHGVILSKVDEAAKLGPAVDVLIRQQVVLRGLTTGQRVPQDWRRPDAMALVRLSMAARGPSAYDPVGTELPFFFADPVKGGWSLEGQAHA
jgi:flagellar biosynthesis protein FlhF